MTKSICVVTGAGGGVGIEIVKAFLKEDCKVVLMDLSKEVLNKAVEKNGIKDEDIILCPLDITDEEMVKATLSKLYRDLGHLDVLVNTAGICGEYALCTDYSFANFKKIYEVNVFGTFLMMKYIIPYMKENGK